MYQCMDENLEREQQNLGVREKKELETVLQAPLAGDGRFGSEDVIVSLGKAGFREDLCIWQGKSILSDNTIINFPQIRTVLPIMVLGKSSPCLYLGAHISSSPPVSQNQATIQSQIPLHKTFYMFYSFFFTKTPDLKACKKKSQSHAQTSPNPSSYSNY